MDPVPRIPPSDRPATYAGRWVILAVHVGGEVVRAEPFTEIELELASLWPEA